MKDPRPGAAAPGVVPASAPVDETRTARAGFFDVAALLARLGVGKLQPGFDASATGCKWARAAMAREGATELRIGVAGRSLELVGSRARSERILADSPADGAFGAGRLKTDGMSFLAPLALTVADGERWRSLRAFNEQVLGAGGTHAFAQAFLDRTREAFDRPVTDPQGIRAAMARAMTGIVLGREQTTPSAAADDVAKLFAVVQSPLRRKLLGFRYRSRRERLYATIARRYDDTVDGESTLIALARRASGAIARDELLQQVPHWMFTFTGSGTDLLSRTLALITSRPAVSERVLDEIGTAGSLDQASSIAGLDYVNACLLETGRLFPPVTRTFHRATNADGGDVVHYFPLLQRDDALGPTVHHFRPERWLADDHDDITTASNLFLRGPRACPGADLILFVCRAALARLLDDFATTGGDPALARDPLPLSFPERAARFTVAEATP